MPDRRTTPQARVVRNDGRVLDAALELLADAGWGGFSLGGVAARAGLSKRPVLDRFESREGLAAALWERRLATTFLGALEPMARVANHDGLGQLVVDLEPFVHPDQVMLAATELLVVRQYEPTVRSAVDEALDAMLAAVLDSPRARGDAARAGYALMLAIGLLMAWPGDAARIPAIKPAVAPIADALAQRRRPARQPARVARHLDGPYPFDTDDPQLRLLLQSALGQVGTRGFDGATTRLIARGAGVSEGYLFGRYATKLELLFDASRSSIAGGAALNERFMADLERDTSPGMAEAVMLRELMRPGREVQRAINLEQQRLVRHHPALRASSLEQYIAVADDLHGSSARWSGPHLDATAYVGMAIGFGAVLLAQVHPEAWRLPYDVVTCAAL